MIDIYGSSEPCVHNLFKPQFIKKCKQCYNKNIYSVTYYKTKHGTFLTFLLITREKPDQETKSLTSSRSMSFP